MSLPGVDLPIVLAPMGGAGTVHLAAAVSNAGGLGFLPCAYSTGPQIAARVAELRTLTRRPFALNLFVEPATSHAGSSANPEQQIRHAHERLREFREELRLSQPATPAMSVTDYREQCEAVVAARPAFMSFTFGIPDADVLDGLRSAGVFTIGTATTVEEARAIERAGVDAVCVQGAEAGAHRGTFLGSVADSLIGTLALVPQVVDAVRIPVIAAGGIGDGRGVAAVLALGAIAAQLGSSFLLADEAGTSPAYRRAIGLESARRTVLTTAFSGRAARGLHNRFVDEVAETDIAPYPFQNALTRDIREASARADRSDFLSLWAGQAVLLARAKPAGEIVAELVAEAASALRGPLAKRWAAAVANDPMDARESRDPSPPDPPDVDLVPDRVVDGGLRDRRRG
jgi:nitronate monooxygenase